MFSRFLLFIIFIRACVAPNSVDSDRLVIHNPDGAPEGSAASRVPPIVLHRRENGTYEGEFNLQWEPVSDPSEPSDDDDTSPLAQQPVDPRRKAEDIERWLQATQPEQPTTPQQNQSYQPLQNIPLPESPILRRLLTEEPQYLQRIPLPELTIPRRLLAEDSPRSPSPPAPWVRPSTPIAESAEPWLRLCPRYLPPPLPVHPETDDQARCKDESEA